MEEIIKRLEACNRALEYAAYNYDGSILEELEPNVIESTGVGTTCLIEIRNNNQMIEELRVGKNVDAGENTLPIQRVSNSLLDLDGKTFPVTFHVSKYKPKIDIDLSSDC